MYTNKAEKLIKKAEKDFSKFSNPREVLTYINGEGFSPYYDRFLPLLSIDELALLTVYISKWKYYNSTGQLRKGGYFYWEQKYQLKKFGMGKDKLIEVRKGLEEIGLIKTKRSGVPPKNYYKIGWKSLFIVNELKDRKIRSLKVGKSDLLKYLNKNSNLLSKRINKDSKKQESNNPGGLFVECSQEQILPILEKWGSFPNTTKHSTSPESKTYQKISAKLHNLLHGRPVKVKQDGSASQKVISYCNSRGIPKNVATKTWTPAEIIHVLEKVTSFYEPPQDNPDKRLSLNNVLWTDFGGEWKSRFLRYARKAHLPEKYVTLATELHGAGTKDDRVRGSWDDVRESALLFRKKIRENVISYAECTRYIRLINNTLYEWRYTPSVFNAKEFFQKHEKQSFDERMKSYQNQNASGNSKNYESDYDFKDSIKI